MKKEIISVGVLSYNSENTILETLNSILEQDYHSNNIELIIGDDASKDNTQDIINNWVNENKNNFHKIKLNLNSINQGVVSNFYSICKSATSDWIKPVAADDLLMKNCISEFKYFVDKNPTLSCIFCKVEKFNKLGNLGVFPKDTYFFNSPPPTQFKELLIDNFIYAPSSFIKTKLINTVNDIDYNLSLEDYPLWLNITSSGIELSLLHKTLVKYRIGDSLSQSSHRLINTKLNYDVYQCKKNYLSKLETSFVIKKLMYLDILLFRITDLVKVKIFRNKKNKISMLLSPALRFLSPLYLIRKYKTLKNNLNK